MSILNTVYNKITDFYHYDFGFSLVATSSLFEKDLVFSRSFCPKPKECFTACKNYSNCISHYNKKIYTRLSTFVDFEDCIKISDYRSE